MIGGSFLRTRGRETPLRNRHALPGESHAAALSNDKKKTRSFHIPRQNRLPVILFIIVGLFGWMQWLIAVTHIHNNEGGENNALVSLQEQQLRSSPRRQVAVRQQEQQRRRVHQIQLSNTGEFHSVSHVSPPKQKQDSFETDWLGNAVGNHSQRCVPMHAWQLPENSPYSCNLFHEFSLDDYSHSYRQMGCGGDRCAYRINDMSGHAIAMKTMRKVNNYYNEEDYRAGWMDVVVTERLSSSPLVVDQYANCGLSMVLELGTQGTLMDHIIASRMSNETNYATSPMTRLKIAHQVAAAVAYLQTIDEDDNAIPPIAHNDLCARQFLFMDGVYKLFDFDSASITKVDKNGTTCMEGPEHMDDEWDKIKAPEEFHRHARKDRIHKYKADVWILGDILYYILTKRWLFEGIPREEAKLRMLAGIHSESVPNATSHSAEKVVEEAIQMAWTEDAEERPSASEVAAVLQGELERLVGKPDHGRVWQVSIPPLPDDYQSNLDDFYDNLE